MLPEGDHGGRIMPGYDYNTTIAEEWHVVPLRQSPGFFAVFRTTTGLLGATRTSDPTAASNWTQSTYASFDMAPLPGMTEEVRVMQRRGRDLRVWAWLRGRRSLLSTPRAAHWIIPGREGLCFPLTTLQRMAPLPLFPTVVRSPLSTRPALLAGPRPRRR